MSGADLVEPIHPSVSQERQDVLVRQEVILGHPLHYLSPHPFPACETRVQYNVLQIERVQYKMLQH